MSGTAEKPALLSIQAWASAPAGGGESMKRVKAACICQTLHFMLKDGVDQALGAKLVQEDLAHYKKTLDRNRTQYRLSLIHI